MQFSFCKALSAPVGSMLLGSKEFIERARVMRQRIGGAMAQAGHMAAAGIVALETMIDRIKDDHSNAKRLTVELAGIDKRLTDPEETFTNIVQADFGSIGKDAIYMADILNRYGIKVKVIDLTRCRFAIHRGITSEDIDRTTEVIKSIIRS